MIVKGPGAFAMNFPGFFLKKSPDYAGNFEACAISLIDIISYLKFYRVSRCFRPPTPIPGNLRPAMDRNLRFT